MALRIASSLGRRAKIPLHRRAGAARRTAGPARSPHYLQSRGYAVPAYTLNASKVQVTTLPSGVRVVTEPDQVDDLATVGLYVAAGSIHEDDHNNGASALLVNLANEHNDKVVADIEALGASVSASATREATSFVAESLAKDVPALFGVLANVINNPKYTVEQIGMARKAVAAQKHFLEVKDLLDDHVHSVAFQRTPYAQSVLGEDKSLEALTPADLAKFVATNYSGPRTIVVGTGAVKHDQLVKLAEKAFSSLSNEHVQPVPLPFTGAEVRIRDDALHTAHATFAWEAVGYDHPHYWSFLLLQELLGTFHKDVDGAPYLSSRLAETVFEEHLGESFATSYKPYKTGGLFTIYLDIYDDKAHDYVFELFKEIQKLLWYISPEELTRAQNMLIGRMLGATQGITNTANLVGRQMLAVGRRITLAESIARVQAVSRADLKEALDTYFYDVDPALATFGRSGNVPDYNLFRSWTYLNRW